MVTIWDGEIFDLIGSDWNMQEALGFAVGFAHPERIAFLLKDENGRIEGALSLFDLLAERTLPIGILQGIKPEASFWAARNFFLQRNGVENQLLPYMDAEGNLICIFCYLENKVFGVNQEGNTYDSFSDYEKADLWLDMSLLDRYDGILVAAWEEYTEQICRILKEQRPEKKRYCLDEKAGLWSRSLVELVTLDSLLKKEKQKECGKLLFISSDRENEYGTFPRYLTGVYSSLAVMKSIYWCSREECFGTRNPKKRILILDYEVTGSGLVDVARFGASYCKMAKERDFYVVMDCRDSKGLLGTSKDKSFWEDYFEPVSQISLEEALQSAHVYRASTNGICLVDWEMNPYLYEEDCALWLLAKENRQNCIYQFVRPKRSIITELKQKLPNPFLEGKTILGVIARGSDYRKEFLTARDSGDYVQNEEIETFLSEIRMRMELGGYDSIYLATEDQEYLECFQEVFGEKLIVHEQKRVNLSMEEKKKNSIGEMLRSKDPVGQNQNYMAIIYALSQCDELYATMDCGAYLAGLSFSKKIGRT